MSLRFPIALALVAVCSLLSSAQSSPYPGWTYASYFGGSGSDSITASTHDSLGNIYVAGITSSTNFPTTAGTYEPAYPGPSGDSVMFVSKFSSAGSLVWSTYLGPGCFQFLAPTGIAVDASQNVYVAGIFDCSGFPSTSHPGNPGSVFLSKLNSAGSQLVYSLTLGGNSVLGDPMVVLDSRDNAYVTGAGDLCCNRSTGIIGPLGGISDFWVAKVNSTGNNIPWSVQIGGSDDDETYGMTIDSFGELYLTGYTASTDFPTTAGALDQPGFARAFVLKLDPKQSPTSSIIYSALAGNPGNTSNQYIEGDSIAVDASGNAYVGCWTYNTGLITSTYAFQRQAATVPNGYVFALNAAGSAIANATYIGGGAADYVKAVAVDNSGNTYVSGFTYSWDFPTTAYGNPLSYNNSLGYYLKLNPQFAAISSVEVGPNGSESFTAVPDFSHGLWVAGYSSGGFATTPNAYQQNYAGEADAYLLHTDFAGLCSTKSVALCTLAPDSSDSERIHFAAQSANVEEARQIFLSLDGQQAYALNAAQFDTWLPVAPGNHTATVTFRALNSPSESTQESFTVQPSATCPINPTIPSLTICNPLNAAVLHGSFTVVVAANGSAPPKIIYLYIDGKFVTTLASQNGIYVYTANLTAGPHTIAVHGTDSNHDALHTSAVFHLSE